jgi:hypothetical protein
MTLSSALLALTLLPHPDRRFGTLHTLSDQTIIYVELIGEAVDVWTPVAATPEGAGIYRLTETRPEDETWAFPPGSRVRCEPRPLSGGTELVAVALAD